MPLYEVLLKTSDREELRLGDQPYLVGSTVEIMDAEWKVVDRRPATHGQADCCYVLERIEPADSIHPFGRLKPIEAAAFL